MKHISRVVYLDKVDSTNEFLKRISVEHGLCIVANYQTKGRGRRGKSWISLKGKGLYLSVLFRKPSSLDSIKLLSLAMGTAVVRVLRSFKEAFYLKWPNDVCIKGKKICGILPEVLKDRVIVGIGVNMYHSESDFSLIDQPTTSLSAEGISIDRDEFLGMILTSVDTYFDRLISGKFNVDEYESLCPLKGKRVVIAKDKGKSFEGICLGVDMDGCLIVDTGLGIERLISSDVSIRVKDV